MRCVGADYAVCAFVGPCRQCFFGIGLCAFVRGANPRHYAQCDHHGRYHLSAIFLQCDDVTVAFSVETTCNSVEVGAQPVVLSNLVSVEPGGSQSVTLECADGASFTVRVFRSANVDAMFLVSDDPVNEGRAYIEASRDHN